MTTGRPSYGAGFYSPKRGGVARHPSLWHGCVAAWCPSLGQTGLIVKDWSPCANDLTFSWSTMPEWFQSGATWGLDFDGMNESGDVATNPRLEFTSSYTLSLWLCPDVLQNFSLILIRGTGDANDIELYLSSTNIVLLHNRSAPSFELWTPPSLNVWTHVAVVWEKLRWKLYYNGLLQNTSASDKTNPASSGYGWIVGRGGSGTFGGTRFYDGKLDDVRLYDRPLTQQQIATLARRRGVAYELARRSVRVPPAVTASSFSRNIIRSQGINRAATY